MQAIEELSIHSPDWGQSWRWAQDAETQAALERLPVAPLYAALAAVFPPVWYRVEQERRGFCHVRHTVSTHTVLGADQRAAIIRAVEQAGGRPWP